MYNMKTSLLKQSLISSFLALFLLTNLNANDLSLYEQLCNLNKYWQQHDEYKSLLSDKTEFDSDRALIQTHLSLVEDHLRNNYDLNLTEAQLSKRNEGLDILNAYWNNGVFPINTKHNYTIPYFIDDYNTACAVGHIMRESGAVEIVNLVKELDNYAYIENMNFPELGEWAKEYGFTVEELKWIQPAYDPTVEVMTNKTEANCGNLDGAVDVEVLSTTVNITNYEWRLGINEMNPVITTNQDLSNASSGFYSLKMFDVNGNPNDWWNTPVTKRISLDDVEGPELNATVLNQTCLYGDLDGSISLNLSGNVSDYQIKWYDYNENLLATDVAELNELAGQPLYFNQNPPPYNYRVEVEDANGCKSYQEFLLAYDSEGPSLFSFQTEITDATCDAGGSIILGTVYSQTAVEYYWNDGNTNADREDLAAGSYTVTIVDAFGCSIQETIEIENECNVGSTCQDLAGIDFGLCDFVLGVALVNGECIDLSGCDWTVNGVDYSDYFFTDLQVCIQSCETSTCNFDGTLESLPWLEMLANGTEHSIQHYIYNGEDVFFHKYCPDPLINDAMSTLYDCSGNAICYFEGFAGFTGENCPGFPYNAIFQSHLTDCTLTSCASSSAADVLVEPWVQAIIDEAENGGSAPGWDCNCYESIDLVSYGDNGIGVWVEGLEDCNAFDFPDVLYTCNGAMVCSIGEVMDFDFCYESITVIENIWTCSQNATVNASLDYKVLLEGAYLDNGTMSTVLYDSGLLPLNQPFAGPPYNYNEPLTRTADIPGAVDWIMLELRENPTVNDGIQVPGILLSDGRIVDPVTLAYPTVALESTKEYFVLVRHRNHLDIYSTLQKSPSSYIPYDFSNSDQHTIDQVKPMADGRFVMYAGDHNSDGTISIGDFDYWQINPAMLNVYDNADYNLDGIVQTTDWDKWYLNRSKIGLIGN